MSKISAFLFISILCACIFTSCTEDIIIPPQPPPPEDTLDWYNWNAIYVGGLLGDLYVADSNNIYINDGGVPIFYDGQSFQVVNLQDPSFQLTDINGYDKENIFFGGGNYSGGDPVLKKMTNGVVTSYTIIGDSGEDVADIYPESFNSAWISIWASNRIYHFNNGSFTQYSLDSNAFMGKFFKDPFGNFYVFALRYVNTIDQLYSYKFANNRFELVAIDTVEPPSEKRWRLFLCGKDILMLGILSRIFYFNGTEWLKFLSPPIDSFWVSQMGGYSKDTIFANTVELLSISRCGVRIWDGHKWHREKKYLLGQSGSAQFYNPVYPIDNRVYFIITYQDWESYLIIGRRNIKRNIVPVITNDNIKVK